MASTEPIALRSNFLKEAAHLLAVSSPSASAFLGSARHKIIEDAELDIPTKEQETFRRQICGACGSLLIPGWSCQVSNISQPQKKRRLGKSTEGLTISVTSVLYDCSRCQRRTAQSLQPQPRRQPNRAETSTNAKMSTMSQPGDDDRKHPKTANASSKQRQKARKGGLQAMLEKSKAQSSSQGLDLMDFAM